MLSGLVILHQKLHSMPMKRKSGAENTETQAFRASWNKSLNLAGELCYARDFVPLFALLPSSAAQTTTAIHDHDSVPMNNWTDQSIADATAISLSLPLSLFDGTTEHLSFFSLFNSRDRKERTGEAIY